MGRLHEGNYSDKMRLEDMRIKKLELEARVNMLTEKVSREVGRLVRPTWNPVREWKRRACEVLGVVVPPGHAPECLKPAENSYDCFNKGTFPHRKARFNVHGTS